MKDTHRTVGRLSALALPLALMALGGCSSSSVGDPCTPEEIPDTGFNQEEAYLETSSVQCQTRVCLVYRLGGDPTKVIGQPSCEDNPGGAACVSNEQLVEQVHCSCRCDAPPGQPTCNCPGDYVCTEILDQSAVGEGVRGSYCVSKKARCCLVGDFGPGEEISEEECADVTC